MAEPEAIECVQRLTKKLRVTPATTKVLSLSIAMLRYLAQGYKAVLVTSLKFPSSPPNLLIGATYGAINALTQALAICWECYIPLPKNIWLELHSLYRIARIKKPGIGQHQIPGHYYRCSCHHQRGLRQALADGLH
jgi:hypothetical protein